MKKHGHGKISVVEHFLRWNIKDFVFGVEDGLVSTLGVVAAIAAALQPNSIVILGGLAQMFAGGISMMAGTYLGAKSELQVERRKGKRLLHFTLDATLVMGASFMVAALLPILPFVFISGLNALAASVFFTGLGLFLFGGIKTRFTKKSFTASGLEMVAVGLLAALAGYIVGQLFLVIV
jgi:predicted membrane protein (TIGR00267 family)